MNETEETTAPESDTETAPTPARLKAEIGYFDGVLNPVAFNQGDNIQTLLNKADINFGEGQSINDEDGEVVPVTDQAVEGKTYYVVGNYKQG